MRHYLGWLTFFTVLWWIVLIPFEYHVLSVVLDPVHAVAYAVITMIAGPFPFYSDSSGMYLLLLVCPALAALTAGFIFLPILRRFREIGLQLTRILMLYFLVLELWKYGWIKLIKLQFYLPEPNTVYSPLGSLSKDIAYWSVIGSSHAYVVFMGIAELLAGTLLLFRRTRFAGLLLALGIFVNVLMVNISFDISVKLFAALTLLMVITLLSGYRDQWRFLFGSDVRPASEKVSAGLKRNRFLHAFVIAVFVVETVYPSVVMKGINDDAVQRPIHHGAYEVRNHPEISRLFVHRQGYVIFEDRNGKRLDLKVLSQNAYAFGLLDEHDQQRSTLLWKSPGVVIWQRTSFSDILRLKPLPYNELPLLQNTFHWSSDSFH